MYTLLPPVVTQVPFPITHNHHHLLSYILESTLLTIVVYFPKNNHILPLIFETKNLKMLLVSYDYVLCDILIIHHTDSHRILYRILDHEHCCLLAFLLSICIFLKSLSDSHHKNVLALHMVQS